MDPPACLSHHLTFVDVVQHGPDGGEQPEEPVDAECVLAGQGGQLGHQQPQTPRNQATSPP